MGLHKHGGIGQISKQRRSAGGQIGSEDRLGGISEAVNDAAFPVGGDRLDVEVRHGNANQVIGLSTGVKPNQLASFGGVLLIQFVQERSSKIQRLILGAQQKRTVDFHIELIRPLLGIHALKVLRGGIKSVEQITVHGIQPAINLLVVRVPNDRVETNPSLEPRRIGMQILIAPSAGNLLLPSLQPVIAQDMRLDGSRLDQPVHPVSPENFLESSRPGSACCHPPSLDCSPRVRKVGAEPPPFRQLPQNRFLVLRKPLECFARRHNNCRRGAASTSFNPLNEALRCEFWKGERIRRCRFYGSENGRQIMRPWAEVQGISGRFPGKRIRADE